MEIEGIRHRTLLRRDGVSRSELARWLRAGQVTSLQPWYITPNAPPEIVALLRLGLRPACLDAASLHGLWTPPHPGTHVYRPRLPAPDPELRAERAHPVRSRDGAIVSHGDPQPLVLHGPAMRSWPDHDPVPDLELVLAQAGRCLPTVKAAVLFESALHMTAHFRTGARGHR